MTMRIAHVISTPQGFGGAESVLAALVARGRSEGWEQLVLNPFARTESSDLSHAVGDVDYRAMVATRFSQLPRVRRWLRLQLGGFKPALVHAHLFHALVAVSSVRTPGSVRVLTHHHGDFFRAQGRTRDELIDRVLGRRFDSVVAVSESVRRFLVDAYRYPQERVVVIRNGWSGTPLERAPSQIPTITCVANFREEKGHSILLQAMATIVRQGPARLVLVGDGRLRERLTDEASKLAIEQHVDFIGAAPNIWPHLSATDVFVLPSLTEPLGIAVMEAMAAGLPVVASRVGGIPELVDGSTGFLVPPGDPEVLARKIVELLDDETKRAAMGAAGRAAAGAMRMDVTMNAYVDHYQRLLASSSN